MRPRDSEIMSWDPESMETYWQQCRSYDTRSHDTSSIMSNGINQIDGQTAFTTMLDAFQEIAMESLPTRLIVDK